VEARSLEDRVALLENEMQALRAIPARVTSLEAQMVQFRDEVRAEFSATRQHVDGKIDELRGAMRTLKDELGAQMRTLHEEALARIALINRG